MTRVPVRLHSPNRPRHPHLNTPRRRALDIQPPRLTPTPQVPASPGPRLGLSIASTYKSTTQSQLNTGFYDTDYSPEPTSMALHISDRLFICILASLRYVL